MGMMNVSLPEKQIREIDLMVDQYGYANRSEFVRSALRFVLKSNAMTDKMADFPFVMANPGDKVSEVVEDFQETGKYSEKFLNDLEEGLKKAKSG